MKRLPNPQAVVEIWMARAFAVMVALYGVRVLVCGSYVSRSEVVVDPVRVWLVGLLMIAVGVFLLGLFFGDESDDKGAPREAGEPRRGDGSN